MKRFLVAALAAAAVVSIAAQQPSRTRVDVETLASARFDGRLAGSDGERLASDFIVGELKAMGAKPLPGLTDYLMPFEFTAGTRDGGSRVSITSQTESDAAFGTSNDVQALSFSDNGDVKGALAFAGYGIVVPDTQNFGYDSYAGLDVKDKIVVVLRYFPEDADQNTRAILSRYSDLRYKALAARQRGAKALIVVTGPRSPNAGNVVPMSFDTAIAGSGIVAVSGSGRMADALVTAHNDKPLADVQKELDTGNPHVAGFDLPRVSVTVHADVVREKKTGHNVLAYLPATGDARALPARPWVALGAHYDHLGHGEVGNSLAGKDEAGRVHGGADDNASGTAAVLSAGRALAAQPRARNVLLALWSGEELGLLGSAAYAAHPVPPLEQMAAYLNFDMVGRMRDNKLTLQATGTSPVWARLIEQANVPAGFDLAVQTDPYQPTDVSTFNSANVPCLNFFTGNHEDYHRPSDTADKIDYEDLGRIVDFAVAIVRRLEDTTEAPAFTRVEQPSQNGATRAGVRVFTGTIPDYATEVKGLLLSGVVGGGPAEQAGLQKGDVIVEIAGQAIANIYDYTYALDLLKIGEPTKVIYLRGGQRRETMLTPAARK